VAQPYGWGHSFYLNFLPDPTTFEGALAVLIVGSLIVPAILGGLRWYLKRRQRKAKEAEARREARLHLRAGEADLLEALKDRLRPLSADVADDQVVVPVYCF
jgi:hypothetical protein